MRGGVLLRSGLDWNGLDEEWSFVRWVLFVYCNALEGRKGKWKGVFVGRMFVLAFL